jgi:uncharacterized membrane protein YbhN (UPF0104 family)
MAERKEADPFGSSGATRNRLLAAGKLLLAVAIMAAVGRRFYLDLLNLDLETVTIRPAWLVLSGVLYVLGLSFSVAFWVRLLRVFGQRPSIRAAVRAYYVGQLGKYVPGKAWALLVRSVLVRGPEVHMGVAAITAFYEVLTTMAAGVLLAVCIWIFQPPAIPGLAWSPLYSILLLFSLLGLPLVPAIFNRLVNGVAARFRGMESSKLSSLRTGTLAGGLVLTSGSWVLMSAGLWATLQGVLTHPPGLTPALALQCIASLSLAYVAGFLVLVVPGGVGVREVVLREFLAAFAPAGEVALAVLILRVAWTLADVLAALAAYALPLLPTSIPSTKKE